MSFLQVRSGTVPEQSVTRKRQTRIQFPVHFDNVAFKAGKLEAVSYNKAGKENKPLRSKLPLVNLPD